jgi:hypothetical protein
LLARRLRDDEVAGASCLDNRVESSSSSFVSAPVFFDFGEPNADANPSLKTEDVLNLSEKVEGFHEELDCTAPGKSDFTDGTVLDTKDEETELGRLADDVSKEDCTLLKMPLLCKFIKILLDREPFTERLVDGAESCKPANAKLPV